MSDLPADPALSAARERTVEALCLHFAEDHLSETELERRLDLAYLAPSRNELVALTDDLPALGTAEAPTETARIGGTPSQQTVIAVMGSAARRGAWTVPRRLHVIAVMGGAELDFREARFEAGVTELYAFLMMGGAEITVPPDVRVESNVIPIMGGVEYHGEGAAGNADAPTLRITGVALMGGLEIKVRNPGERRKGKRRQWWEEREERQRLDRGE